MALYLSGAKFRPISYRLDAGKFTAPPLGYIVHVPVSNGSLFDYFNSLTSPGRKFCTAWIAKDGSAEQYTELTNKSWAQADGNGMYWSFEVEGFPGEPMTDAQLDTLARWHKELGVVDAIATAPGQKGIGTHQMGGAAWGGHSCPGAIRTAQLPQIITRANAAPKDDDMTPADLLNLMHEAADRSTPAGRQLSDYLSQAIGVPALRAAVTALSTGLGPAVEKAVADALAAQYDATVTLSPKAQS